MRKTSKRLVVKIRNKTGWRARATAPIFDGKKYVISIILDALQTDPAFRKALT